MVWIFSGTIHINNSDDKLICNYTSANNSSPTEFKHTLGADMDLSLAIGLCSLDESSDSSNSFRADNSLGKWKASICQCKGQW